MSDIVTPTSQALGSNPKDILGAKKIDTTLIPAIALAWEALAMMDGAGKYDPYNWRVNKVVARIYVAAAKRHLDLWLEGQEEAEDSKCHHLGHARACCGILLDAQTTGNLIDDRPIVGESPSLYQKEIEYIASKIPAMQKNHRKFRAEKEAKRIAEAKTFGT
jgi:Domain of unknown function (DUF5664)